MTQNIMEQDWLTIEETEQGKVLTKCLKEATGEIVIPDGVTEIGSDAFSGCTALTSINIPDSVTEIGSRVFGNCCNVQSISISENNASFTSKNDCCLTKDGKTLVFGCQSSVIPDSVTKIGYAAFKGCSRLTSIEIPCSVKEIGNYAFLGCTGLTSIEIPESVENISSSAFAGCCNVQSISISENNASFTSKNDCCLTKDGKTLVFGCQSSVISDSVTKIGDCAFDGCTSLTSVNIPDSVTEIGDCAFNGCTSLTSVNIPDSVTEIGEWAFNGCTSLTSVNILHGITHIKHHAFAFCSRLASIKIPGVIEIGNWAFKGCSSLTSIEMSPDVEIDDTAFEDCHCKELTLMPPNFEGIKYPYFGCGGTFESVVIPSEAVEDIQCGCGYMPIVRINTPRNELRYNDKLIELLGWGGRPLRNGGKLILAAPQLCEEESTIPGYIRVTRVYEETSRAFDETCDKEIDINTKYIAFIEPTVIERFEPCNGTIIHVATNSIEHYVSVTVYEDVAMVAEKIKTSLSRLSQEVGGAAGLLQQLEVLCKPEPQIKEV